MVKLVIALMVAGSLCFNRLSDKTTNKYNYTVITDSSVVEWQGASPKVRHKGAFSIVSQGIEVVDGQVVSGTFSIPIASITNADLPKVVQPVLLKHLKSKDFFHQSLFPEATFSIQTVTQNPSPKETNAIVTGEFTMLGNTHPVSFPANIHFTGGIMAVEATFVLDRTQWGMTHAADPGLGNRHIFPQVDIHLKLYAHTK
jgi:polyisoprenoid-binding protein YceI